MSEVTIKIDGVELKAKEGEYILNVARANNIFIPAICYVTRCSPTLACRLCLVEADGKQVYACNAKVKDGMNIVTSTENIEKERRAIMEVYDVNHPLQCGVCDKSGECELQNYNLYMQVDSQHYAIRDINRPTKKWGVMSYDPGLCIVCEKCVTICKDMIGSSALSTVKRGGDPLDKNYKASMPKDAYAMWNKLNKSLIGYEPEKCIDCGECVAVCPVGALVDTHFKYTSNAWELKRIPASNPHSSDCSLMYYEVKHTSIDNVEPKIYRVTNDHHYVSLSGAARYSFDVVNKVKQKDKTAFNRAIEAFKKAKNVVFNSYITNEEAKILQSLKEKLGFNLVNEDAAKFKEFLKNYSSTSGKSLYSGDLQSIHKANFVISVGSYFKSDAPSVRYAFNNAISINKGAGIYFHPLGDSTVEGFGKKGKTIESVFHKPLSEEAIMYFILDQFSSNLPKDIQKYLDSFKEKRKKVVTEMVKEKVMKKVKDPKTGEEKEVPSFINKKVEKEVEFTYTKLLDLIGASEELLDIIESMKANKDKFVLILGSDLYTHPRATNIAKLAGLIEKYANFEVVIIPSQTNTLGVSLICDLDNKQDGYTVGYNEKGDFVLSSLGEGDLDMPTLIQSEGTFVSINKRVVPTNAALPYYGYELNDIANELLDDKKEFTIDWTKEIFEKVPFDNLNNCYENDWSENRGYKLSPNVTNSSDEVEKISSFNEIKDIIIYNGNPINQFNDFTARAKLLEDEKVAYYISSEFLEELELKEGEKVLIETKNGKIELEVKVDKQLVGKIGYVPTFDSRVETKKLFKDYRFESAKIKKV